MRANEFLTELFQPGKEWEWDFRGSEEAVAKFTVGDIPYWFVAYAGPSSTTGKPSTIWEIEFKQNVPKATRNTKFGLTKTGNAAAVMSTVTDIMRSFLEQYKGKVTTLIFSAEEDSRQALYARMVKRLLPDWTMENQGQSFVLTAPGELEEEILDEMPLPTNWDPAQLGQGTSFKARLAYALERAQKLGTGSSRVAMIIEYEGRQTVLKIAKNAKGLAQNSVEASILDDGYASQLGILIPLIDYDTQHREPHWIHTELAQKATDKQLSKMMGVRNLDDLVMLGNAIAGKSKYNTYQGIVDSLRRSGLSDDEIQTATDYANTLADLASSFDVELGDFGRKANWGLYQGKPVIIDVGFNSNVLNQYYK
jgi:hypothetical protein